MHLVAIEYIPYLPNGQFFSIHTLPYPSSLCTVRKLEVAIRVFSDVDEEGKMMKEFIHLKFSRQQFGNRDHWDAIEGWRI